jgi:peroxiredoxin
MQLKPKDKAPDFELLNQDGKKISLKDFRVQKVLLLKQIGLNQ